MTITKALRKLYKVIVGEEAPANANTITKVLLALAEAWTGSGGSGGGSGGGGTEPLIVNIIDGGELSGDALDRTWQEIHDAFPNVILRDMPSDTVGECESLYSVIKVNKINGPAKTTYSVEIMKPSTAHFSIYSTEGPNGYPKIDGGGIS